MLEELVSEMILAFTLSLSISHLCLNFFCLDFFSYFEQSNSVLRSTNDETKLFLAFEFISAHKRVSTSDVVGDSDNNSSTVNNHKIDPLVFVNIASSTTMKQAELLLRDEDLEVITCSDEVLFQMARVLRGPFAKSGLIDIVSSLTVVEGYLEPICPPSTPPTPLNVTGEEINVKNIEEEDYDEYNDSFEFEEEIYSIDGFGAIKPEFIVAKNINGFVRWRATTFAMAILFFITVVVLVLLHDKDVIKEINSFNGQWKDVNWFKFLPKDFQSNLLDSSLAGLIDGLYNLTTNYVTMSPV